jgi:hypothetical protein
MKTTDVGIMDTNVKTIISKYGSKVYNTQKKIPSNRYEPEEVLKDKVYLETYYKHQPRNVIVDETPTNIKGHGLQIAKWTLIKDQQLMKLNLGIDAKPQMVKINA